jgi:anti-sigma B factor antagonist
VLRTALTHRLQVEEVGGLACVRLLDRHIRDGSAVLGLGRDLAKLLNQLGRHRLLLDFTVVEHLSSAFLEVLLKLHRHAREEGGWLALCGLRPSIAEALRITGLNRVLSAYPDQQQALASLLDPGSRRRLGPPGDMPARTGHEEGGFPTRE